MISTDPKANYLSYTAVQNPTLLVLRVGILLLFASISVLVSTISAQDTLPYVKSHSYISPENETFFGTASGVEFRLGVGLSAIGDLDGNGVADMVASSTMADSEKGEIYVMLLNSDGSVLSHQIIKSGVTNGPTLDAGDRLGGRLSCIGDLDGDGVPDLAALASKDDDAGTDLGAIYILFLNSDGSLKGYNKFTSGVGGFTDNFNNDFTFLDITGVGDVDGDGVLDLAVGSPNCDLGGTDRGAFRYIYMNSDGSVKGYKRVSSTSTWPGGSPLINSASFGFAMSSMGDLNGDGITDLAISARKHNNIGRVYILFMTAAQEISSFTTIEPSDLSTTFGGVPHQFSWDISAMGDLNADGVNDLLITARLADNAHTRDGQAVIVYLNEDGTVQSDEALGEGLSTEQAGMGLHDNAWFGFQCAALGDVDGDKVMDIALSAIGHNGGGGSGAKWGRVYLMNLNPKPLVVSTSTTRQSANALGTITVDTYGGVRPYSYKWGEDLPSDSLFYILRSQIDQNFNGVGIPLIDLSLFEPNDLADLSEEDNEGLVAGVYTVQVIDQRDSSITNQVQVGFEFSTLNETGAVYDENGEVIEKTGGTGWTNMQLSSRNVLASGEDGWISFVAPDTSPMIAVGMRKSADLPQSGYTHMEAAVYLSNDSISFWDGSNLIPLSVTFQAGDKFRLERNFEGFSIIYNDEEQIHFSSADISDNLVIDVAIYESLASIQQVQTSFPAIFNASSSIIQLAALSPASGTIDLSTVDAFSPFTYSWNDDVNEVAKTRTALAVGNYTVNILSGFNSETQVHELLVGNEIFFEASEHYSQDSTLKGIDVNPLGSLSAWGEELTTINSFEDHEQHWVSFRPERTNKNTTAHLVGLKNDSTGGVWCGWWVHSIGELFMAQAFNQSGLVGRTLIRDNTRLSFSVNNGALSFELNDQALFTSTYTTLSGPSRMVLASNSAEGTIRDLVTSISVPIILNTSYLEEQVAYDHDTPDGLTRSSLSGGKETIELSAPLSGDHEINVSAATGIEPITIKYELSQGAASNMRIVIDDTTYTMDPQLYTTIAPNQIVLFDEAENYFEDVDPVFEVVLEGALVMSPNGDTQFDEFEVILSDASLTYQLTIRDRQSTLLFQSTDPNVKWNGQFLNTGAMVDKGIYVYEIDLEGTLFTGQFMVKY